MNQSNIINIEPLGFPWKTQDPFLFCAYHRDEYPEGNEKSGIDFQELKGRNIGSDFTIKDGFRMYHGSSVPGFPYHPHRGFETITINKEGVVDHTDSLGAAGRFMGGDVQWMTAGRGIQHSEMFPLIHEDNDNPVVIFQIWLNLPKISKMVEPHFKMHWKEDIPVVTLKDSGNKLTVIEVIAGDFNDVASLKPSPNSWANNPDHVVGIFTIKMEANATFTLPKTHKNANRSIFYYKGGNCRIENTEIEPHHLIEAQAGEDIQFINGNAESFFLILEGIPIQEPVVQHGPFVMNTEEEIRETMKEYGKTQFGGWPWPESEMVFPKNKGRFALHANGVEEIK